MKSLWQTSFLKSVTGHTIRCAEWRNNTCPDGCVVFFINGRNEFIEKYKNLPGDLSAIPGTMISRFLTFDHPGQGSSDGLRSHIGSFATYAEITAQILSKHLRQGQQFILLAHSMGALISLYAVMNNLISPKKILLSSPFLGLPDTLLNRWLAAPLCKGMVSVGLGKRYLLSARQEEVFEANLRTHSRANFYRLKASPYQEKTPTFSWVKAAIEALDLVHSQKALANIRAPVSIWIAEQESIVSRQAIHRWALCAGQAGAHIALCPCPGARHELLFESAKIYRRVLEEIAWQIQGRVSGGTGQQFCEMP